jgi:hypothetical protein
MILILIIKNIKIYMFNQYKIECSKNIFFQLKEQINFENITTGRIGGNILNIQNNLIPIVRTTTKYKNPAHCFTNLHFELINKIKDISNISHLTFNNALIEIYTNEYKTMKFHSDQALDLKNNSYICIYSCYSNPLNHDLRKLIIKNKLSNEIKEINLFNNSITIFSTTDNSENLHKIILDTNICFDNSEWMGITFRLSKTFIKFINEIPYFYETNNILKLVSCEKEKKEFYNQRKLENQNNEFTYQNINYTISPSDLLYPIT